MLEKSPVRLLRLSCVLALAELATHSACRSQSAPPPPVESTQVERGPLRLTVEAAPKEPWLGDPVNLTLRVQAPDDFQISFPPTADLSDLTVRTIDAPEPRPAPQGGRDWQITYVIETGASGPLEIPALTVKYARTSADDSGGELVSDPLRVDVRSALTTQDSTADPRDITGALTPPAAPRSPLFWIALIAGLLGAAAVAALIAFYALRVVRRPPLPVAPEVWALHALAQLDPTQRQTGDARPLYYRMSEIVRTYIERKFGLAAPEMTTEEFLRSLSVGRNPLQFEAARLTDFMRACDVVKYAAFDPRTEDAAAALQTARDFVVSSAEALRAAQQVAAQPTQPPPAAGRAA